MSFKNLTKILFFVLLFLTISSLVLSSFNIVNVVKEPKGNVSIVVTGDVMFARKMDEYLVLVKVLLGMLKM